MGGGECYAVLHLNSFCLAGITRMNSTYTEKGGTLKGTGTLNGSLGKTVYGTATSTFNFGIHPGIGTTLEITSYDAERHVTLTAYKETLYSLDLPEDFFSDELCEQHGGGYMTMNMKDETYISRWQLNDLLNGLGWKLIGYSAVGGDNTGSVKEIWAQPRKELKVKKHRKSSAYP